MRTFFSPREYDNAEEMSKASFFDAVSDTTIDGVDVFGYVNGEAYAAEYIEEIDEDGYTLVWVSAGAPLNQYDSEGCCPHCGKSLSEYDGNCRWSDCIKNR